MCQQRVARKSGIGVVVLLLALGVALPSFGQLGMFTKGQRLDLTREWKGDRFDDGRPKVPDSILEGLQDVDAEEAWGVLRSHGYRLQFEGGWHEINPGGRMVGRVFTAAFMPLRPDVNDLDQREGQSRGANRGAEFLPD